MHCMNRKERLNLTVRDDFKTKAAKLADQRRRSISALFEDLIDEEWERAEMPRNHSGQKGKAKK